VTSSEKFPIGSTRKMKGRIYTRVELGDYREDDIIFWSDARGSHSHFVQSATNKNVIVHNHPGLKPKTKLVSIRDVKECWRWHRST
jgi:hypothetical protein